MNKAILIGNVGQDPELRTLNNGTAVLKFGLATSKRWTDSKSHEPKEETQWHRITVWGKMAEVNANVLRKGVKIAVEGEIKYSKYEKDGHTVYATDIVAKTIEWLFKKEEGQTSKPRKKPEEISGVEPVADDNEIYSEQPDDDIPF